MTNLKTILIAGTAAMALGTAPAMAGLLGGGAGGGVNADVGVGTSGLNAGVESSADADMRTSGVNGSASSQTEARGNVEKPNASSVTGAMKNSAETGTEMGADGVDSAVGTTMSLKEKLMERGYTAIERTDKAATADGKAEFKATNKDGKDVKLVVNTRTGAVIDEKPAS